MSDERLAGEIELLEMPRQRGHDPDNVSLHGSDLYAWLLDLRDARARIAELEPKLAVLRGALVRIADLERERADLRSEKHPDCVVMLASARDALDNHIKALREALAAADALRRWHMEHGNRLTDYDAARAKVDHE